jgi:choline kinase
VEIGGKTLLRRQLDALAALGIPEAVVVVGYRKEQVTAEAARGPAEVRVRVVENARYLRGDVLSLWHACQESDDDVLIIDGAILFPQEMLARLLATPDMNAIAVDEQGQDSGEDPKVVCEDGWVVEVVRKIGQDPRIRGQAVGMLRLSGDAAEILRGILEELIETDKESQGYEDAFRELAGEVPIGVVEVGDLPWIEVGARESLDRARDAILPHVERLDRGEPVPTV